MNQPPPPNAARQPRLSPLPPPPAGTPRAQHQRVATQIVLFQHLLQRPDYAWWAGDMLHERRRWWWRRQTERWVMVMRPVKPWAVRGLIGVGATGRGNALTGIMGSLVGVDLLLARLLRVFRVHNNCFGQLSCGNSSKSRISQQPHTCVHISNTQARAPT